MQNHFQKDLRQQRERPLQKSMFLPDQYQNNRNPNIDLAQFHPLKKSAIGAHESNHGSITNLNMNKSGQPYDFHQGSNQLLFTTTPRNDGRIQDTIPRMNNLSFLPMKQQTTYELAQKIERLSKLVNKHDLQLMKLDRPNELKGMGELGENKGQIIQEVISVLKQQHLPQMLSKSSNEFYEYVFNFKLDIQALKEEVTNTTIKLERFSVESEIKSKEGGPDHQVNKKIETQYQSGESENSKKCHILQSKLIELEKQSYLRNEEIKSKLIQQDQKIKSLPLSQMQAGTLRSKETPIIIEYLQIFKFKPEQANRSPAKRQIVITSALYYIDKEGFLMDNQNRYIVDQKGTQIKLDLKHVELLKNHNILS